MWKEYPKNKNYLVSEDGRIYSKKMKKELTPKKNWDGYYRIQIWEEGKNHFGAWHRIVAETWLERTDGKDVVNHKNGNKTDNRAENLEWVSQKENVGHAWRTGLSNHKNHSRLPGVAQFDLNGNKLAEFETIADAAEKTGENYYSIRSSALNNSKGRKNYVWRFLENSNDYSERKYTTY